MYMVIAGMINRVAFYCRVNHRGSPHGNHHINLLCCDFCFQTIKFFYCRVNHRDRDYEKYLDDVMRRLEEEYGKQKWDLQIFFEEASGADPNRYFS